MAMMIPLTSRDEPTQQLLTCHMKITGKSITYYKIREYSFVHGKKVIARLRRMGKQVKVTWVE